MKETKTKTTAKKAVSKPASKVSAKSRTKTPAKSQAKTPEKSSKNKVALSQKIRLFWDTVRGSNDTGTIFGILLMTVPLKYYEFGLFRQTIFEVIDYVDNISRIQRQSSI